MHKALQLGAAAISLGLVLTASGSLSQQAFAMGIPQNGSLNILQPGTVTVEGIAVDTSFPTVNVISTSYTVTDSTMLLVNKDSQALQDHLTKRLRALGIPMGDIELSTPSYNFSQNQNQSPNQTQTVTVIVANQAKLATIANLIGSYSPSFVSNAYTNTQILPLNPAPLYEKLYSAAIADARQQATALAAQGNEKVGAMLGISTVPAQGYVQSVSGPYPTSPTISGVQISTYNNGVTLAQPELLAQVFVTFALQSK